MPSIQYKLIETMFGALGVNKMLDKQGADFEKLLKKYSEKQKRAGKELWHWTKSGLEKKVTSAAKRIQWPTTCWRPMPFSLSTIR